MPGVVVFDRTDEQDSYATRYRVLAPGDTLTFRSPPVGTAGRIVLVGVLSGLLAGQCQPGAVHADHCGQNRRQMRRKCPRPRRISLRTAKPGRLTGTWTDLKGLVIGRANPSAWCCYLCGSACTVAKPLARRLLPETSSLGWRPDLRSLDSARHWRRIGANRLPLIAGPVCGETVSFQGAQPPVFVRRDIFSRRAKAVASKPQAKTG